MGRATTATALDEFIDSLEGQVCTNYLWYLLDDGRKVEHTCPFDGVCRECELLRIAGLARTIVLNALGPSEVVLPSGSDSDVSTHLVPEVFEAWAQASGDPDTEVPRWLRDSAPAGLSAMPVNKGIFPAEMDDTVTHDEMTEFDPAKDT